MCDTIHFFDRCRRCIITRRGRGRSVCVLSSRSTGPFSIKWAEEEDVYNFWKNLTPSHRVDLNWVTTLNRDAYIQVEKMVDERFGYRPLNRGSMSLPPFFVCVFVGSTKGYVIVSRWTLLHLLLLGGGWVGVSDGKIKVLWAALCRTVRLIEAWLMMRRTQGKARTTTTKRSQSTKWGSCREFSKSCAIRPSPLNPWCVLFECFSAVQKRKVINRHEKEVSSTSSSRPHLESTPWHPPTKCNDDAPIFGIGRRRCSSCWALQLACRLMMIWYWSPQVSRQPSARRWPPPLLLLFVRWV